MKHEAHGCFAIGLAASVILIPVMALLLLLCAMGLI